MKHPILLIITIIMGCEIHFAQASTSDLCRQWLISDVNRGKYDMASKDIQMMNNWDFKYGNNAIMLDLNKAEEYIDYMDSVGIAKNRKDSFEVYTAITALYMSDSFAKIPDFKKAIPCLLTALKHYKNVYGENHIKCLTIYENIGVAYAELGNGDKAIQYFLSALEIMKENDIKNTIHNARILSNMCGAYTLSCKYDSAEHACSESVKIRESIGDTISHGYIQSLDNYSAVLKEQKSFIDALKYSQRALCVREQIKENYNLDYARELNNLGTIYIEVDSLDKAIINCKSAISLLDSTSQINNPIYANILLTLAIIYTSLKQDTLAEQYYFDAIHAFETDSNIYNPAFAGALNNFGYFYEGQEKYSLAKDYYQKALDIRKTILSDTHIDYATSLKHMAHIYQKMKEYPKTQEFFSASIQIVKDNYISTISYMNERQRKLYWDNVKPYFFNDYPLFSFLYYPQNHSIAAWAYNNELFLKGLLLNSSNAVKRSIYESGDTMLNKQFEELITLRRTIITLNSREPNSKYIQQYEQEADVLEKALIRASAPYRENQRQWDITWDSVRNALLANQVAIEFMETPIAKDSTMYCALLIRDTCSVPILIPLFERKKMSNTHSEYLCQQIWQDILPYLNIGDTVFFAPAGVLHQIAIENLPIDSTHSMGDIYNMVRLSSTREITLQRTPNTDTIAVLYGGIEYDIDAEDMSSKGTNRSSALYLEGTQQEIDEIHTILTAQDIPVTTYENVNATEESFKALSGKQNSIIHIATHGFYWSDSTAKEETYFAQRASTIKKDKQTQIDPLSRCGLLFAGANNALEGNRNQLSNSAQDGVLTAKEISTMDFRGTDIVVLSACETGLGEISADGVYGLQRAFKMAGVKTILMSLWQVDDNATKMLMTAFYRYWIGEKQTKRDAFRKAQNDVRAKYGSSEYWAGFILLD